MNLELNFTADVPPGDVFSFNMPEDGILFKGWNNL
jgi:hypothetical protein